MNKKSLFRKDIEPKCSYCKKSRKVKENLMCIKTKSIIKESFHCKHFEYCPLKRIPKRQKNLLVFNKEDFEL